MDRDRKGFGTKAAEWKTMSLERADEVSRALVRVGVMTQGQVTRLLRVNPKIALGVVKHNWDRFVIQRKVPHGVTGGRYVIQGNRIPSLIHLTDSAMSEWSKTEGIERARNHVKPSVLPQTLNVGEILICLRRAGLLYDRWDIMLPQDSGEGLHAWLIRKDDEFLLGMFTLPTRLSAVDEGKLGSIFNGIIRRVVQNSGVSNTLFLVARRYYAKALSVISNLDRAGRRFYLLPLETFLNEPEWYLEAIAEDDQNARGSLIEYLSSNCYTAGIKHKVPAHYNFAALMQAEDGYCRLVDSYVNGSIDRLRDWRKMTFGYLVPATPHVASGEVYVYDEHMRDAVQKVLQTKRRGEYDSSIVDALPWPRWSVKSEPRENSLLDDEEWWKVFDE